MPSTPQDYARRLHDALKLRLLVGPDGKVDYKRAADEIAAYSGEPMDGPTLRRYVTGERMPRIDIAARIAKGLRMSPDFWFVD